ncbi:MAG: DUF362 domain-containing protein [Bryobacterales bacterium]|nr:DUF362 domain-containing protein [Bryobacterales bacterium]
MITRRGLLAGAATAALMQQRAGAAPIAPVAIQRCRTYGAGLEPTMRRLFDGIGGLGRLVNNKTVAIKVNLTGRPSQRLGHAPAELAHWTHPRVIGMAMHLMNEAGAKRIRILESPWSTTDPLEEYMMEAGWDPSLILNAAKKVEFENTNYLGNAKQYTRFKVPNGGHMFPAYDLNHSYADCDVFVSIAKAKEHATAGITLSMKNCFGITPCTIYGDGAGEKEPGLVPVGGRGQVIHSGARKPSLSAPQELHPDSPRDGGYRVPRVVADLNAARPIDLAIIEGVESMAGGEGPWIRGTRRCSPGFIIAGTNAVCTDAVATAVLGFDPMAMRGAPPFEHCDNTLALAEQLGVGSRDLTKIEVAGAQIADVRYEIRKA